MSTPGVLCATLDTRLPQCLFIIFLVVGEAEVEPGDEASATRQNTGIVALFNLDGFMHKSNTFS